MPASDALLTATAALLLIALAWQVPRVSPNLRVSGLGFATLGALLPLLDPLLFTFGSEDQIGFLTRDPVFAGPLPGLAAIALATGGALLLGAPAGRCVRWAGWTAAGLMLAVILSGLTAGGTPWLAPFRAHRYALPVLPQGHLWLIAVIATALALLELGPRVAALRLDKPARRRWVLGGTAALLGTMLLSGAWAWISLSFSPGPSQPTATPVVTAAAALSPAEAGRDIEMDPVWPGRWLELAVDGNDYVALSKGLGSAGDAPSRVPRWNDQMSLLQFLEDPVVRRLYFEAFRHPVARTETSGSKIRLSVRELGDALIDEPGPTLHVETDTRGRMRHYEVERLD